MRRSAWIFALATFAGPWPNLSHAEESKSERVLYAVKPEHDIFKFDYGAPTSPAMNLLGLTPDKSPSSTSLTDFVVSMPTVPGGKGGDGLALDFPAARLFIAPENATFDSYTAPDARLRRLGFRTRVGLAFLTGDDGGGDPKKASASRLSFGFSTSLLDSSDPLMAGDRKLGACLASLTAISQPILDANTDSEQARKLTALLDDANALSASSVLAKTDVEAIFARAVELKVISALTLPDSQQELHDALNNLVDLMSSSLTEVTAKDLKPVAERLKAAGVTQRVQDCTESANLLARAGPDIDLGFGVLAQGTPGQLENLSARGVVLWGAFKRPLGTPTYQRGFGPDSQSPKPESSWFLVGSSRFSWDERLQSGNSSAPEFRADTRDAWIGFERLTPSFRFTGQYGWLDIKAREPAGKPFEKSGERYLLSGQIRLGDKNSSLWLGISYGNGYGTAGDLDAKTALVTLSYSPKPINITGD